MKVVQINAYYNQGSTGKICKSISNILNKNNIENYVFYTQNNNNDQNGINYNFGKLYTLIQSIKSKILGNNGFNSKLITYRLIKYIEEINPDIVHLHNLHAQNINLTIFLDFLKQQKIKTIFTFHDCWLITGYCTHFDMVGCDKWKYGCRNCEYYKNYSFFVDKSYSNWEKKKRLLSNLNPVFTAPSKWMVGLLNESSIKSKYNTVIYNGIDLKIFYPRRVDRNSIIKTNSKYIVLGVSERWNEKKGLDVFINLSKLLDKRFQIVLIGTDINIDQILPNNIISIHRTSNQSQLAEYYTISDVFVNTTREEVLGLVNIESLACGTPVITFDTGGSSECIDESTGIVVKKDDIKKLKESIEYVCISRKFTQNLCVSRAEEFNENILYEQYVELYKSYYFNNGGKP